ncbi:MAG: SRPBCC family protein [Planctomycetota bacterium]
MQITRTITIDTPVDRVWDIVGPGFTDADRWACSIDRSEPHDGERRCDSSPFTGRVCETSIGTVNETVLEYDDIRRRLSYEAYAESMPGFVRRLINTWRVAGTDHGTTQVEMQLAVELAAPFNFVLGPLMRWRLGRILRQALRDLKHFAETSEPSLAKAKAISRQRKKPARPAA